MKNLILIMLLSFFYNVSYCQKKKVSKNQIVTNTAFTKLDNISAEMISNDFSILINNKGAKKDSIKLKSIDRNKLPLEAKLSAIATKSKKLYMVNWKEKSITTTKLKTEEATSTHTVIFDILTKIKLLTNIQTTTNIKEIHYLDTKQTVSETLMKIRKEGFELSLNPDGDVVLKNKTQENRLSYDPINNKFVNVIANKKK